MLPRNDSTGDLLAVYDLQNQLEADRKKAWGEEKKQRSYEGMYDEEHFAEREGWSDDDFM